MSELPYQVWERVTGKSWSEAKSSGLTNGSAEQNLALADKLNNGFNPYAPPTATPASAPVSAPASDSLAPYIDKASAILNPQYNAAAKTMETAATTTKNTYDTLAAQQLAREPLVRQTYANLAKEFSASQGRETNVATRIGEQNIGAATAGVAATGTENAQGAFRAPITQQQDKLIADIGTIADKYNLKQESLTSEMNSSIQDLYDKADAYKLQGQNEYSKAMVDIARLKIDQKKDVLSFAREMFGDDMEVKKLEQQIKNDERQFKLEQDKFAESQRQFAISQANSKSGSSSDAASKATSSFQKDVAGGLGYKIAVKGEESKPGYITRETFIKKLQLQNPEIDAGDISRYVYEYYSG